ncbi:hypothetical protein COLO4_28461 [Corchorus olitorius]|uniref:Uncharacterized protein n=1 Tax=Corchorus olitorius TaxID=93759 RepID=A0A1R3HKK6_9ROSI|nr:hypothetical protein COLO4_28461 [Corchorus olitorius]
MNQTKVHSQGNVPFSWENKPGVCKMTSQDCLKEDFFLQKLPPPPCPPETARVSISNSIQDNKIPPPPGAFQPPSRSSSRRGLKKSDDPFLAAYKECTKSTNKGKLAKNVNGGGSGNLKKGVFSFSCKQSCSVRDDNLVRISQLPPERDRSSVES